jgi:hypothetical protein
MKMVLPPSMRMAADVNFMSAGVIDFPMQMDEKMALHGVP